MTSKIVTTASKAIFVAFLPLAASVFLVVFLSVYGGLPFLFA